MTTPYIPGRFDGKVALVTGSGRGIGASIAALLGKLGANVVVNYANSIEPAEKVVTEIKSYGSDAIALKADVRDVSQTVKLFDDAVAHFHKLDIVCSNSGVVSFGHLGDVTEEEFDRVFSLNTRGQFFVAREGYRHLREGGRIILMSSNTAKDFSVPNHSLYSGSKGAIDSFVRVFAKDCGHRKITVNAVAPGGTVTDMFHEGKSMLSTCLRCSLTLYWQSLGTTFPTARNTQPKSGSRWLPTHRLCTATDILSTLRVSLPFSLARRQSGLMGRLSRWTVEQRSRVLLVYFNVQIGRDWILHQRQVRFCPHGTQVLPNGNLLTMLLVPRPASDDQPRLSGDLYPQADKDEGTGRNVSTVPLQCTSAFPLETWPSHSC